MRMSSLFGTHSQFIVKPNLQGTLGKLSKTVKIQNGSCVIEHPERNHHDMVHFYREEVHLYGKEISGFACPFIRRYRYDSINHVINLNTSVFCEMGAKMPRRGSVFAKGFLGKCRIIQDSLLHVLRDHLWSGGLMGHCLGIQNRHVSCARLLFTS